MTPPLDTLPETYEDIMRQVFDQSTQGFQVINKDWEYVYVNEAVARQGKRKRSELIGKKMMELYPGIEQTPLFSQLQRSMDEKVSIKMENEFVYPDGSKGWFQLFIHPWTDGVIIFSVDITDRKQEEYRLAEKIKQLNGDLTSTPEGREKLADLNQALSKLLESSPEVL